jgi:chromosome segregation ATPase
MGTKREQVEAARARRKQGDSQSPGAGYGQSVVDDLIAEIKALRVALDQAEHDLCQQDRKINDLYDDLYVAETERDALRAKLEQAEAVIEREQDLRLAANVARDALRAELSSAKADASRLQVLLDHECER